MEAKRYYQFRRAAIFLGLTSAFVMLGSVTFFFVMESTRMTYENKGLVENVDELVKNLGQVDRSVAAIGKYGQALDRLTKFSKKPETVSKMSTMEAVDLNDQNVSQAERVTAAVVRINQLTEDAQRLETRMEAISMVINHRKDLLLSLPSMAPTEGQISSPFGVRNSPFTGEKVMHRGVDIKTDLGAAVYATAAGTVIFAGVGRDLGKMVTIDHGFGIMTKFGHNSALKVRNGEKVRRGQLIALAGNTGHSTGPHVHYEVWVNDQAVDPMAFLPDLNREALAINSSDNAGLGGEETVVAPNSPLAAANAPKAPVLKSTKDTQRWFWPMVITMFSGALLLISISLSFTRSAPRKRTTAVAQQPAPLAPLQQHFVMAEAVAQADENIEPLFVMKKAQ